MPNTKIGSTRAARSFRRSCLAPSLGWPCCSDWRSSAHSSTAPDAAPQLAIIGRWSLLKLQQRLIWPPEPGGPDDHFCCNFLLSSCLGIARSLLKPGTTPGRADHRSPRARDQRSPNSEKGSCSTGCRCSSSTSMLCSRLILPPCAILSARISAMLSRASTRAAAAFGSSTPSKSSRSTSSCRLKKVARHGVRAPTAAHRSGDQPMSGNSALPQRSADSSR